MTPEQEQQVARALAEAARHEPATPMPDDVARRLDAVLADLREPQVTAASAPHDEAAARAPHDEAGASAPHDEAGARAPLDEVAAARRRRRPRLLAAAAAAAVVAVAGGALVTGQLDVTTGSDTSADSGVQPKHADKELTDGGGASDRGSAGVAASAVPELSSATLARDVQRVVDAGLVGGRRADLITPANGNKAYGAPSCLRPPVRRGERLVAVRLDGRPASLVLGPAQDGARSARVYPCAGRLSPVARTEVQSR